ncbi:unnamed protein product [Schistosoma haematobium]|nr:unnamed protein product [Schistosoma haematobium]
MERITNQPYSSTYTTHDQMDGVSLAQGLDSTFKLIFYGNCVDVQNCLLCESNFETTGVRQRIELPFGKFTQHNRGRQISNRLPPSLNQVPSKYSLFQYIKKLESQFE